MKATIAITKAVIKAEPLPAPGKRAYLYDAKVNGLTLQITAAGARSWQAYKWAKGRQMRITLGRYPDMTIEQARRSAMAALSALAAGENPTDTKRAGRVAAAEPTFGEVLARFLVEKRDRRGKLLADKTKSEYRRIAEAHLGGILKRKLSAITVSAVSCAHQSIASASTANQLRALLSSVWNFARRVGLTSLPNPGSNLDLRHIEARDRFLQPDELPRFFAAVEESSLRDFFLLALLTGARRSNLQAMRWAELDLDSAVWRIARTKNGTPQNVTLAPEAVEILRQRIATSEWVFPGPGKSGHLTEPKGAFSRVLRRAGIENLRIHDLRRTLGSWQARQGASLAIIGKSLNHKSQHTTAIYARLDLDPVRQSVDQAAAAMLEAGGLMVSAKVVPIRTKKA